MTQQLVSDSPLLWDRVRRPCQAERRHYSEMWIRCVSGITFSQLNRIRTVSHAHAHVVDHLPVLERLMHGTLASIVVRIVVVLKEVPDEELALRLRAKEQSEAEGLE